MIEILIEDKLIVLTKPGNITIGRDTSCSIVISERTVSRRHATIYISKETGIASITDGDLVTNKPSANGVKVNGTKLNPNHGEILQDGDTVELSPVVRFRFFCKNIVVSDEQSTVL